jgi:hypothetical protein
VKGTVIELKGITPDGKFFYVLNVTNKAYELYETETMKLVY